MMDSEYENETENGLKYTVLERGTGEFPKKGQTILMHYELWLGNGTMSSNYDYNNEEYIHDIYDSTYDENNPFHGPIKIIIGSTTPFDEIYTKGQSIRGLDEALMKMKVGEKRALLIPSYLGYGYEGASSFHTFHGYRIPPNQSMRCNIELVGIIDDQELNEKSIEDQPENIAYEG